MSDEFLVNDSGYDDVERLVGRTVLQPNSIKINIRLSLLTIDIILFPIIRHMNIINLKHMAKVIFKNGMTTKL